MKIVLKIFYVIFVIFLVATIQMSGGVHGLKMVSYSTGNLHVNPRDTNYTLGILSGVLDIYIDTESEPLVIPVKTDDGQFDFKLTFFPFGSPKNINYQKTVDGKTEYLENLLDGFIIHVSDVKSTNEATSFNLVFTSENLNKADDNYIVTTLNIKTKNNGTEILPEGYALFSYGQDILGTHVTSVYGENVTLDAMDFSLFGNYNVNSLQITTDTIEDTVFYGWEPGTTIDVLTQKKALKTNDALLIDEDLMLVSKRMYSQDGFRNPTAEELLDNPNVLYTIPNLSPYNFWLWIIIALYTTTILVIPYFLMIRKPIKKMIARKKEEKERIAAIEAKKESSGRSEYKTVQDAKIIAEKRKNNNDIKKD